MPNGEVKHEEIATFDNKSQCDQTVEFLKEYGDQELEDKLKAAGVRLEYQCNPIKFEI